MKRFTPLALILPVFLLVLTGCGQKANQSSNQEANSAGNSGRQGNAQSPRGNNMRRPDFGQPDRAADLSGVVKSIVGNEVTVLKIDMTRPGADSKNASSTESDVKTDAATKTSLVAVGGMPGGGGMPTGGMPTGGGGMAGGPGGMPGGQDSDSSDSRAKMMAALKEMSTGEEEITIPVGIKMLKSSTDDSGQKEMVEATLSDLTSDKMITVWLNASVTDKKVAEFVLIN